MKKTLLAAAVLAAASMNSFGVACTSLGTQSINAFNTNVGNCTIGNGGTLWSISNLSVFNNTANGTNIADMTDSALLVSFSEIGNNGFSVTYTTPNNTLFTYNPTPAPAQKNAWSNGMWVTGLLGAGTLTDDVVTVGARYDGATGDVNYSFRKIVQNRNPFSTLDSTLLVSYGTSVPLQQMSINGSYGSGLSINDIVAFDSGGTRGGSITSYTNFFYGGADPTGVPEPMSFVLMGAGLVGIAALRRRSS